MVPTSVKKENIWIIVILLFHPVEMNLGTYAISLTVFLTNLKNHIKKMSAYLMINNSYSMLDAGGYYHEAHNVVMV